MTIVNWNPWWESECTMSDDVLAQGVWIVQKSHPRIAIVGQKRVIYFWYSSY
jgi:hypothetical protein